MVSGVGAYNNALAAYKNAAKMVQESAVQQNNIALGASGEPATAGGNFQDVLKNRIDETASLLSQSEQVSQAAIAGKADIKDVVTAVASAEVALKTVVAVRDSVISAYQEILKMPV